MYRQYARTVFLLCCLVFGPVSFVWANGPADAYKVSCSKFELYNGTSWVTIFSGTSTSIDIASVSSGQSAGNFISGLNIPDGTYSQMRVTPVATFTIKGNDGSGRYTTSTVGGSGGCVYTNTSSSEAQCTVSVQGGVTATTNTLSPAITISNGIPNYTVRVSFDTSSAIQYVGAADELFPAAPTVTISVVSL